MIEDIEFFAGAPELGHWPVLFDIDIPVKYDNPKRCVLNYEMANWEEIGIQLENIMVENMDSMITEAPTKALLMIIDRAVIISPLSTVDQSLPSNRSARVQICDSALFCFFVYSLVDL